MENLSTAIVARSTEILRLMNGTINTNTTSFLDQEWHTFQHSSVVLLAITTFLLYRCIAIPLFLSPLSRIPSAHPLASFTSLWIDWKRYKNREFEAVHNAFEKYGPFIRLGPNEIAINSRNDISKVYGAGHDNFDKHVWYEWFINHGKRNTFTSLGANHAPRRKVVNGVYGKAYLQRSRHVRAIIAELVHGRLLPLFHDATVKDDSIDVLETSIAYSIDFLSAFEFGLPRATNFLCDVSSRKSWLDLHRRAHPLQYMWWFLEHWQLTKLLTKFGIPVVPNSYFKADAEYDDWGAEIVERTEHALQEGLTEDNAASGEWPIEYCQLRKAMAQNLNLGDDSIFKTTRDDCLELASECLDHLNATRDIMPTILPLVFYYLSSNHDAQIRLRDELRSIQSPLLYREGGPNCVTVDGLPEPSVLESLPFLNAVLKESIRLRNGQPVLNPRVTPAGKRTTLGPYKDIPPGVRVVGCAYSLHRNEEIFLDCKSWVPQRWLDSDENDLLVMKKYFWGFGSGSRQCLGQNVAMELLRFAIAAVYTNFETDVVDDAMFNDKMFITGSLDEKLLLRVKVVE